MAAPNAGSGAYSGHSGGPGRLGLPSSGGGRARHPADKARPLRRNAGQIDAPNATVPPVDCGGTGQDHLDHADVDADRHGSGTLICTLAAIPDKLVTTKVPLLFPKVALRRCACRRRAASGWFPYAGQIGYTQVTEVTETVQAAHGRSFGRHPLIDQCRGLARPVPGVVTA